MYTRQLFRLFSILIVVLFIIGCGEETIEDPTTKEPKVEQLPPNYYPDTIGSRWVYRNPNGFQWAREVTGKRAIGDKVYHVFAYDPPLEDPEFDFHTTPSYRVTRNYVQFFVGGEINQSVRKNLSANLEELFAESGDVKVTVNAASKNDLTFFRIPPSPGQKWDVLNMQISGRINFTDLNQRLDFKINWVIKGLVVRREAVTTPAGTFPDSFKVQYSTKVTTTVEGEKEEGTAEELETVWLAPEIGMVKIETENGVTELVEYDVKPAAVE